MFIRIQNKKIGFNEKPFIISELGINHGGDFKLAKRMVDLSIANGADAIKNQTHFVDCEMIHEAKKIKPGNAKGKSIYEVIKKNSLKFEDEIKLKNYVESKGGIYLSTPFSIEAAIKLNEIGVRVFKIGSGEFNNLPLIERVAKFKKTMILSTGMNDINSIKETVKILEKNKIKHILLHCISEYPAKEDSLKLDNINFLKKKFKKSLIGYSDHSIGILPSIIAMSKGACVIEKHFTDMRSRKGPDIICSMDSKELKILSDASLILVKSRGIKKSISKQEIKTAKFAFASVVTTKKIFKGEKITKKNSWVKRPGTGDFLARDFNKVLGSRVCKDIKSGVFIKKNHLKK